MRTTIQEEAKALLCNAILPLLLEQLDYRGTGGRVGREGLVSCDVGGMGDYATRLGCVFSRLKGWTQEIRSSALGNQIVTDFRTLLTPGSAQHVRINGT